MSIDLSASLIAFNAYSAALNEWSAICAVATACPTEWATAISIGLVNTLATAIESNEEFLASPTEALSFVQSFAILIAFVSRTSTLFVII